MSEYQYYEFRALDRPLTTRQRSELRAISTRAEITSTSFTNSYTFGDFKGDPVTMVERYFDAFLYLANWGTRDLMFRVAAARVPARVLRGYLSTKVSAAAWSRARGSHVIVGFRSEDDEGDWDSDGEDELASIEPVRSELSDGDLRPLYLGWLLRVQAGEIADDTEEPEVPTGLARLSAGETAMIDFLRIDEDLVAVAAQKSGRRNNGPRRRTAGELRAMAQDRRIEAERRAAQAAAIEREQKEAADAIIWARHLSRLGAREDDAWREVEGLIGSRRPTAYDQAVAILRDLGEIAGTKGRSTTFRGLIEHLRARHGGKGTFLARLDRAGI
jgi:hypothetical protein